MTPASSDPTTIAWRATVFAGDGPPVVFLHGGGQTRYAWDSSAEAMQQAGWTCITVDLRGHGESDWIAGKHYAFGDFASDAARIGATLARQYGRKPIAVGASLGGISALIAQYEADQTLFEALVLVDVTPRMRRDGVDRIIGFMSDRDAGRFCHSGRGGRRDHRLSAESQTAEIA